MVQALLVTALLTLGVIDPGVILKSAASNDGSEQSNQYKFGDFFIWWVVRVEDICA